MSGGGDYIGDGKNYDFPDTPSSGYAQPTDRRSCLTGLFPASNFGIPTPGSQGNELRNRFRGPGYANTDISVLKGFAVSDFGRQELRADDCNVFNRVNLTSFQSDLSKRQLRWARLLSTLDTSNLLPASLSRNVFARL